MGIVIEYFAGKNCNYFIFLYNRIVIENNKLIKYMMGRMYGYTKSTYF
jgi:hypothetical protein